MNCNCITDHQHNYNIGATGSRYVCSAVISLDKLLFDAWKLFPAIDTR